MADDLFPINAGARPEADAEPHSSWSFIRHPRARPAGPRIGVRPGNDGWENPLPLALFADALRSLNDRCEVGRAARRPARPLGPEAPSDPRRRLSESIGEGQTVVLSTSSSYVERRPRSSRLAKDRSRGTPRFPTPRSGSGKLAAAVREAHIVMPRGLASGRDLPVDRKLRVAPELKTLPIHRQNG